MDVYGIPQEKIAFKYEKLDIASDALIVTLLIVHTTGRQ